MADETSDRASEYIARWNGMKSDRQQWMTLWDECARYICQRKGDILTKFTAGTPAGREFIYDSTALEAANIGAAGMMTHIMPAGEKWFRLQPKDREASDDLKEAFDKLTDLTLDALISGNFYQAAHEDCLDDLIFCSSLMLEEQGKKNALNFVNIPVGTFAWCENSEGIIDTVAREWTWTARQAAQKWGLNKLGKNQQEALKDVKTGYSRQFTYIHFVEPREDANYRGGPVAGHKRPWKSVFICLEDQQVIEETGYYSMPYFGSRLLRSNNEAYGRGPGLDAMPEIKLVNAMERDILTWTELMANPSWLVPDDTASQVDNRPGGITYWDATNPNNKPEQILLKNRVDLAEQKTEQKRNRIRRAFFNDLFQMLTNMDEQKREKTAYEVQQMVAEKLLLFSPLFARYTVEKLNPMLERTVDILARSGALPPDVIEALQGAEYEITYISKVALAIKAAENQAFATMMTLVSSAAAFDPSVVNVIDWGEGVREVARNVGVKSSLVRSKRMVQQMAQAQAQAQQMAQGAQIAETATKAAKNIAEARATAAAA
jgi:hypothetical protein